MWDNCRLIGGCLYSLVLARGLFLTRFPSLVNSIMGVKLVRLSNKLWNRKTQQILFLQSYENVVKHLANFVNKTLRNIWWLTFKTFICVYFVNTIVIESAEEARKKSLSSWNSCNSLRTGWTYARKDQHKGFGFSLTISIAKLILFEWQRMKKKHF